MALRYIISSTNNLSVTNQIVSCSKLSFLVLLISLIAACGGGGGGDGGGTEPEPSQNPSMAPVTVFAPTGSSSVAVKVSIIEIDPTGLPELDQLVSPVYDIGPSGTQFDIPVTIGIPIGSDTPAGTVIEMVRLNAAGDQWEELDGNVIIGSMIFAETDHFSIFATKQFLGAQACDNLWSGGPGNVVPLLIPGGVTVSSATRMDEVIRQSGSADMALGSTWSSDQCSVVVSGNFGTGLSGDGRWIDYSNGGMTAAIPQTGGAFSFTVTMGEGPYLGLTDPCNAALGAGGYMYDLNINFTAANCAGGGGGGTGLCPVGATTCGSSNAGKCVQGMCMVEVSMADAATSGNSICQAEGLMCVDTPVLNPPEVACKTFHPTATLSADAIGWKQGIYCNNNPGGKACLKPNDCHNCPACVGTGLGCAVKTTDQIESIFANCQ